jgi:hypothetical protein
LRSVEYNPAYPVLADLLERHVTPLAGTMMRSPFPAQDLEQLRATLAGAGFKDVRIRVVIGSARYPSAEEFVRREAASSPLAGPLGGLSPEVRQALIDDLAAALRDSSRFARRESRPPRQRRRRSGNGGLR